jgi:CheY-like chemotaxis protein
MKRNGRRVAEILLVEDNEADARLAEEALKESGTNSHLHLVENGVEAMAFLRQEGEHANAPRPDVILLDLNMPRMDGREVLAVAKSDPALRSIPIVVLSTSSAERDVKETYDLHANCFITKPLELDRFIEIIHQIEHFWLDTVQLPVHPVKTRGDLGCPTT